jgi:hypothetical protein
MPKIASQKMQGEKVRGSQNGDFIDIKNDLVCKSRDRLKSKSAICFLPVSLDPGERYSCCANISNLRQHLWHMLAASLRRSESRESRSKNTPSLLKIQGIGLCSVAFCTVQQCGFFLETGFRVNGLDIIVFGNHFFRSFLCILLGIRTQTYRNPTYFLFEKFPLKPWQLWILFCLSFQTCWDFKARFHFVPFDKKGKALGTRLPFWSNFGAKLWS